MAAPRPGPITATEPVLKADGHNPTNGQCGIDCEGKASPKTITPGEVGPSVGEQFQIARDAIVANVARAMGG